MKNNTMAKHGTIHPAESFNDSVENLIKGKFIALATKEDIEAAKKLKEKGEAESKEDDSDDEPKEEVKK